MKKYRANFIVKVDEDGIFSAADPGQGIFTDGTTKEVLINNIHEAAECRFHVPSYDEVDIRISHS